MITSARKLPFSHSGKENSNARSKFQTQTGFNFYTAKTKAERHYGGDVANIASLFEPDMVAPAQ